jgi:hypothetical protein
MGPSEEGFESHCQHLFELSAYQPNFAVKAGTYMGEVTTLHTYMISIDFYNYIYMNDDININMDNNNDDK